MLKLLVGFALISCIACATRAVVPKLIITIQPDVVPEAIQGSLYSTDSLSLSSDTAEIKAAKSSEETPHVYDKDAVERILGNYILYIVNKSQSTKSLTPFSSDTSEIKAAKSSEEAPHTYDKDEVERVLGNYVLYLVNKAQSTKSLTPFR